MVDPLFLSDDKASSATSAQEWPSDDASGMRAIEAGDPRGSHLGAPSNRVNAERSPVYEELTELAHAHYRILRDLRCDNSFLVLPERYCITRTEAGEAHAYEPALSYFGATEASSTAGGLLRLNARVMPNMTRVERHQMMETLRRVAHGEPQVQYPSEVECGVTCHVRASGSPPRAVVEGARVTRDAAGFHVTLTTDAAGSPSFQDQLVGVGVFVDLHFEMEDRTILVSQIEINPQRSSGPWLGGPLEERREGDTVVLTNRIEHPLWIWEILVGSPARTAKIYAIGERLSPGETTRVRGVDPGQVVFPVYEQRSLGVRAGSHHPHQESRSVVFVSSTNLHALGAKYLLIESRLEGSNEAPSICLSEKESVREVEYLLSPEQDLDEVILEFRVSAYSSQGEIEEGHWQQRHLQGFGNIIEIGTSTISARTG